MESNVTLPQNVPGRGNIKSQKSAIRLTEVKYCRVLGYLCIFGMFVSKVLGYLCGLACLPVFIPTVFIYKIYVVCSSWDLV